MSYKKLYMYMLESGELHRVFSDMTGDWDNDRKIFTIRQKELEDKAGIYEVDQDEYND